jgi:hypothetical protein
MGSHSHEKWATSNPPSLVDEEEWMATQSDSIDPSYRMDGAQILNTEDGLDSTTVNYEICIETISLNESLNYFTTCSPYLSSSTEKWAGDSQTVDSWFLQSHDDLDQGSFIEMAEDFLGSGDSLEAQELV